MPRRRKRFAYYDTLSPEDKRIYRQSDKIEGVALSDPAAIRPLVPALRQALETGERAAVQGAAAALVAALIEDVGVEPVEVEVLESRPKNEEGELHGLYTFEEGEPTRIQVWMRTAAKGKVVAWRSFLRTLLHELCHHFDYHLLSFPDSLHTQGFYMRESDLFAQIVPAELPEAPETPEGNGAAQIELKLPGT